MGRKRKGRATRKNRNPGDSTEPDELRKAPHSFVITRGNVSGHVEEITKDFRKVMEPFTASSLKARKKNTLKDFVSVAGPLNVSHMCVFTQTERGVYLRVARLPRGPTLTMRVHSYCLSRDVLSSLKKPVATSKLFTNAPLVVLNSFSGEGMHLKLLATTFQNMFPSINLTKVKLSSVRRCLLLSYDPETKLIDLRHYAIRAVPVGLSRGVKKLVQAKVPDLSKFSDISEYITRADQLSESEAEEDPNSHVELPQELASRGNMVSAKSAVRLVELGPRLTLQLVKVEEGLMSGEVMFHEYVHKSEEEKEAISKMRNQKMQLKAKRRKEQEDNSKRKQAVRDEHKQRSIQGQNKTQNAEDEYEDDDAEWYRSEVGHEPGKDLFDNAATGMKRKLRQDGTSSSPNKKVRFSDKPSQENSSSNKMRNMNKRDFKSGKTGVKKFGVGKSDKKFGGKSPISKKKGISKSGKAGKRSQGGHARKRR